jgi:hypothetical protein
LANTGDISPEKKENTEINIWNNSGMMLEIQLPDNWRNFSLESAVKH